MVNLETSAPGASTRRLHDDRTYVTTDPHATRAPLLAHAWTPRRMRGNGELWRLGKDDTEAACYPSGMLLIHGAPVDLLAVLEEGEQ
ncbi:MAG: hypothetical protein M3380_16895 [Chloroflexota bacterium]|nr:hypothetical protein [Chloroflexota bacterium]